MNRIRSLSEYTPLLQENRGTWISSLWLRYKNRRKCLTSKGALVILMWNFAMVTLFIFLWSSAGYLLQSHIHKTSLAPMIAYGTLPISFCFCPIFGYLADNKYGRYKMVIFSMWIFFTLSILFSLFETVLLIPLLDSDNVVTYYLEISLLIISVPLIYIGMGTFNANILPLAMDQLYDFNTDEQSLFIHWFIWIEYALTFLLQLTNEELQNPYINLLSSANTTDNFGFYSYLIFYIIPVILLAFSLYLAYYKKDWFLIEPSRVNPYKLVYKVTKFSWKQKVPLNRSAFTYCEDDIPSGLNLAKHKYGGPFTTEQVEDVKVFYGIIKVLFTFGLYFFIGVAADTVTQNFIAHGSIFEIIHKNYSDFINYHTDAVTTNLIGKNMLSSLVTIISIPLYLFLLRPLFLRYIPGMLKRIGIGLTAKVLSLLCTLAIGVWAHSKYNVGCLYKTSSSIVPVNNSSTTSSHDEGPFYDIHLLMIQSILQSLSNMLVRIGILEFVSSQSPLSMKGLIIGVFLAIEGFYNTVGALVSLLFAFLMDNTHVSCGVTYYAMNVGVGVLAVIVYGLVARTYKYRERDEVSNIYMYAENYYSKGPLEE